MNVTEIVQRLDAKRSGNGWKANCPSHQDRVPSLSISEGSDGRVLLKCFAGCDVESICAALDIRTADLFPTGVLPSRKACDKLKLAKATVIEPNGSKPPGEGEQAIQPRPLGELLDSVRDTLRRYVSFQFMEQPTAIALWVLHTWAFEAFYFTPYLHVFSAETSSGKSRLLEVLALLVNQPWKIDDASTSTLFRRIETDRPTLLHDEIDNVFRGNGKDDDVKDKRACLNSGFKWDGKISRCVGQHANLEVKEFSTFSPKALAGIGEVLSDTLSNRCIGIKLVRRTREERVERFREREAQAEHAGLRAELEAWATQPKVIDALKAAKPALPEQLTDRQQDITEPLIAIADLAGGKWPDSARNALIKLCLQGGNVVSVGVQLLGDIKTIFDQADTDKLPTLDILNKLVAIDGDRPWAAWWLDDIKYEKAQKPATRLAKLLKPYGIKSRKVRIGDDTPQGYHRLDCLEAWKRYLPEARTSGTSGTPEGKNVPACDSVPALVEEGGTGVSLAKNGNVPDVLDVPAFPEPSDGKSHDLLVSLICALDPEVRDGLWPNEHPACQWGYQESEDGDGSHYPSEYTTALDYLRGGNHSERAAFRGLSRLIYKIEIEDRRGTPLCSNYREWREGSYPQAFLDAHAYVEQQMARLEQIALAA